MWWKIECRRVKYFLHATVIDRRGSTYDEAFSI